MHSEELRKTEVPPSLHVQCAAHPPCTSFSFDRPLLFNKHFLSKDAITACSVVAQSTNAFTCLESKKLLQSKHHHSPLVLLGFLQSNKTKTPQGWMLTPRVETPKLSLALCLLLEARGV